MQFKVNEWKVNYNYDCCDDKTIIFEKIYIYLQ